MKRLLCLLLCMMIFVIHPVAADDSKRIVSLVPSGTELIYELGLLEQLVGVTTVDSYPEELEDMDLVKFDAMMLDVEALITLQPTHIVTHEMSLPMTEDILNQVSEAIDVEMLVIEDEKTLLDITESIEAVGEFLEAEDAAQKLVVEFLEDIEALSDAADKRAEVIVFVSLEPEIYTVGRGTFIDSALGEMGFDNVFDDIEGYKSISIEDILLRAPEYAVNITSMDEEAFEDALSSMNLRALNIQNSENQCTVDPDLLARAGIRIVEGLEAIEECISD